MWISLMAYVPDELVKRCVIDVMNGNGKLDGTEARRKVTTGLADRVQ
jgi:hypothetical protein